MFPGVPRAVPVRRIPSAYRRWYDLDVLWPGRAPRGRCAARGAVPGAGRVARIRWADAQGRWHNMCVKSTRSSFYIRSTASHASQSHPGSVWLCACLRAWASCVRES